MRLINLLPPSQIKQTRFELISLNLRKFWVWVSISLIVLFVLAFVSQIVISNEIKDTDDQIGNLSDSLQSSNTQELEKQVVTLNNELKNFDIIQSEHYFWSNALIELGNIIPQAMSVSLLTMDRETGEVQIMGVSKQRSAVLEFWANVKRSDYFQDINFPLANLESAQDVNFNYTFFINQELIKQE
ncbi:MAG: PilN domain-containing protein [Candidatus Doudnabacteria bacterium]|nr:PilN domain-containing protein [Candidatus Doudnabacteria bacterium]